MSHSDVSPVFAPPEDVASSSVQPLGLDIEAEVVSVPQTASRVRSDTDRQRVWRKPGTGRVRLKYAVLQPTANILLGGEVVYRRCLTRRMTNFADNHHWRHATSVGAHGRPDYRARISFAIQVSSRSGLVVLYVRRIARGKSAGGDTVVGR
jgi:hypothetical protein